MNPSLASAPESVDVCPTCKRRLTIAYTIDCEGHTFPVVWHCLEHGAVTPMRSAVVNRSRYPTPDWSAA